MRSAVEPDNLPRTLAAAIRRYDGRSPVTEQVRYHFARSAGDVPLRMQLVVAVAEAEGAAPAEALDAACAVEILHHCTLVHEAVVSGADPDAVPGRFGLAHGINAGDALCALAYLQLVGSPQRPEQRTVAMTRVLHEAYYALCAARAADGDPAAILLGAACELGALAAGTDERRARDYAALGRGYGAGARGGLDPAPRVCDLLKAART